MTSCSSLAHELKINHTNLGAPFSLRCLMGILLMFTATQLNLAQSYADSGLPRTQVLRAAHPIALDGHGSDRSWAAAPPLGLLYNNGHDRGKVPERKSEVRLLWDVTSLYIFFQFESHHVKAFYHGTDVGVWDDPARLDIAETILDPEGLGKRYFEINATPGQGTLDCVVQWHEDKPSWDRSWPSKPFTILSRQWKSTPAGGEGWSCEMAIPWAELSCIPHPGLEIRADFFRADSDLPSPYLAWSPTGVEFFHVPSRFGSLVLCDSPSSPTATGVRNSNNPPGENPSSAHE